MPGVIGRLFGRMSGARGDTKGSAKAAIADLTRANPVLGCLAWPTVARLIERGETIDVPSGEILIRQGDASGCAYLVLEGDFNVSVETSHGDVPLARVSAGALIGEIGVFAELPRTATIRAAGPGRVMRLDRADLLQAGDSEPALLRSIITRLGGQIAGFNHAVGLYTNAVLALEKEDFDPSILDQLRQPLPELVNFAQSFRRMAEQIVLQRRQRAEMASAAAIQRAMLPPQLPPFGNRFDIFACMKPAREVGGDFYDVFSIDEERIVFTIGDVSGKGVPASLFMAVVQTVMRLVVGSGKDIETEITKANDLLVANNEQMMFATFFCGILDLPTGRLTYCNCGHNPPLLFRHADGSCLPLAAQGPPLGIESGIRCASASLVLAPGDVLFLYTDGVTEAENAEALQFGTARLEHVVRETRERGARQLVETVMSRVGEFAGGAAQSDDITCIALVSHKI
jgi:serine phosphatase RsbU (regulator of sigma subunit)